ncbi:hypothetical protein [Peredibacter starrii]|uniref:IgGFc-binding protein N-terminal domain-containing protein n=1 Tax=Peredibacter starrii TaxID=28202 RepID=A0AAX4HTL3_9BACT|nr:hypothetical protein [Peredibacter starrii]WPU66566.1 hypothetical protein SOO65_07390 [Peredibacter starrii]
MNKFLALLVFTSMTALAQEKGPVTPTSVTYTFNSAQLTMFNDDNYGLFRDPIQHTFRKSDPDFGNAEINDVTVGFGRYKSISLCFSTTVSMTFNGEKYNGRDGTNIDQGDLIYGQANGTVSTVNPGAVHPIQLIMGGQSQWCTSTYFKKPLCVVGPGTNTCEIGDDIYSSEGKININTGELDLGMGAPIKLQISFLMDMLNGVIINADTGEVTTAPAVKIVMGKPGAAIHLGKWDTNGATDVSMIFSNDKTLLSVMSSEYPGTHSQGFCSGQSNAYVTSVPFASSLPTNSINFITYFDDVTGKVAYPNISSCMDENNCNPVGFNLFSDVIQEVSQVASVECVDENDADIPPVLLQYGYLSVGSGEVGGPQNLAVQRIVDPTNLFGICTPSSTGYLVGKTGVCSFVGSDVNGY